MVKDALFFSDICEEILETLEGYCIVGHNIKFDIDMLTAEFERNELIFNPDILFCTMKLTDDPYDDYYDWYDEDGERREKWQKLSEAAKNYKIDFNGNLHDALVDAEISGKLFVEIHLKEIKEIDRKLAWHQERLDKIKI